MQMLKPQGSSYGAHLEKVKLKIAEDGTVTVGNYKLGMKP